ncbi:molybdopterin binding oxidoreductase [Rhizodiscina lignyota]|uniref:Molybdopterin binding oxidoreductase n=1 Tax=Rhizodiscina lignyota TaxID=1504668 RepID=A0A9P4IFY3_9PEZI|nr:molybdopterin binding oxidoreductase [Rhizodiscina lignyota]
MSTSHPDKDEHDDAERKACIQVEHGFHIRHPPPPHELHPSITDDDHLFQTIHMGSAVVDLCAWRLVVTGLVQQPLTLTFKELTSLPCKTVTSFHECYGPPGVPPIKNYWRVGNVQWTGMPLRDLLARVSPLPSAKYVWSDSLDYGTFKGISSDRYQKDLPLSKALSDEVLIAYLMNGEPLSKERGWPARLLVPGWFGTNSTKWLSKLSLQAERSKSHYTTTWYNELDPTDPDGKRMRPVWNVEPNSIIVRPKPHEVMPGREVHVEGWSWSCDAVAAVEISLDSGKTWQGTQVERRTDYSWQKFRVILRLPEGLHTLIARATCMSGAKQPLSGRRNYVHSVTFSVGHKRAYANNY